MEVINEITSLIGFKDSPWSAAIVALLASGLAGTGIFSFLRRIKSSSKDIEQYFSDAKLLSPPMQRPAYSDRMAYVLAEMADLAYYEFEGSGGFVNDAVENALKLKLDNSKDIRQFLDSFCKDLMGNRELSIEFLEGLLSKSGLNLGKIINDGAMIHQP